MTQIEQKFKDAGWILEHHAKKIIGKYGGTSYELVIKEFVEEGYTYEKELEESYNQIVNKGLVNN